MTKKDYVLLAEAFAHAAKSLEDVDPKTFGACINCVATALQQDNPRFDVQKFYVGIMQRSIKE